MKFVVAVNSVSRIKIKNIYEILGCLAERSVRKLCGHSLWYKGTIGFRDFDAAPHFPSALEEVP